MGHLSSHPSANCEVCKVAKQTRKSFPKKNLLQENYNGLVCPDVMGPFEVPSNTGMKYIATFILKSTKYAMVYPMRSKSEIVSKFDEFYKEIALKTNITIKRLRSDNGGEYKNKRMSELCEKLSVSRNYSAI
jgi:hypothetical protein